MNIEKIYNTIVKQVIFMNDMGDIEYHPERLDFLESYFYLKYFTKYEVKDYDFDVDIISLDFVNDIVEEVYNEKATTLLAHRDYHPIWSSISVAVREKIDFEKNAYFKQNAFSTTDVYLATLIDKLTTWIDENGFEDLIKMMAEAGDKVDKNVQ